jgi:hypothetical protein
VSVDEELDQLLAAPLPSFVEERKRLADALKAAGRKDDAKAIAKINKPTLPVWVINQIARAEQKALTRLGVLTDELREMPAGGTAAAGYAQLVTEHREVLRSLRAAADKILTAAAHDAGPALVERIVHSLRAGMADPEVRAAIEQGRLLREIGEVDFTTMVGGGAGAGARASGPSAAGHAAGKPIAAARTAATTPPSAATRPATTHTAADRERERAAIAAEREHTRARAAAEREVERTRTQLTGIQRRVAEEERALESARRVLEAANRALESARRTLDEKEERSAGALREAELAERALEAAEAALKALTK